MKITVRPRKSRWYYRLPAKWAALGLVVLMVCFPYPRLLARHLQHWRDPNALINPGSPALEPLLSEARALIPEGTPPKNALSQVQTLVLKRVPYAWDWDTWGMADYLPTVAETLEKGAEDCDGRAVVAASILAGLGYDAKLVTDFAHVWVRTEHGDLMGPGRTTAIVATERGLSFRLRGLTELPRALAYGVAVFPIYRELMILLAAWALLCWPGFRPKRSGLSLLLLIAGLMFVRYGSAEYLKPVMWLQIIGALALLAGVVSPLLGRRGHVPA